MTSTSLRTGVRRVALAIAAATALTGMAACTSTDPAGRPAPDDSPTRDSATGVAQARPMAELRSAERSTDRADSARVESTTTMGTMMSMTADGVLGWGDDITGTLTITYTGGTMADTMRRLGSASMEARYLPDAYYARMGDEFAAQAGGRHWLKYAYDDLEQLAGSSGAYLEKQLRQTTPDESVRLLLESDDVRTVGEERIRGERTTHYSGTVDVGDAGVTTQTVDIWVNDRDLLVKKVEKGRMTSGELTQTAYYSDYGAEVTAEEPPAADTQDVKDLLKPG
ncbi:hypothetical protein [Streptomyces sp. KR55]|uniref:hypothetical protein n=1 Tax=Streptomyces sp. KR55 TaxID=3457425 RepID=UPI003FD1811C